jgi:NADP-dependent 3-hydroxy acid dehydrogenase YdfG
MTRRSVLISGANRGIGAAVAERLANDGWAVSLGMRTPTIPDWVSQLPADQVQLFAYDATNPLSETKWVQAAEAKFGRIDALVANAGVMIPRNVIEAEEEDIRQMMEVNVMAPRRLAKAAWTALGVSGRGRIIILASLSGKRVKSAVAGSYAMTKFATVALSHALRHAGFDQGIRTTAICPGFVATDMARTLSTLDDSAMTNPVDLARIIALALDLPNEASVAEIAVNCQLEESY